MKRKSLYIFLGAFILLLGISVTLAFVTSHEGEHITVTRGLAPIASIAAILPLAAAIIGFFRRNTPVANIISCLKEKYDLEKRKKSFRPHVSRSFVNSRKYRVLLNLNIDPKRVNIKTEKSSEKKKSTIVVTLEDARKYTFEVVQRDKSTDKIGISKWVVNNIKGGEFGLK